VTPERIDAFCKALPGATMEVLWGADWVYKVGGKMFAATGPGGGVSFKANDVAFEMLVETGAARPAPYSARFKWVFVDDPSGFPEKDLKAYLTEAHALVAAALPKKKRAALGLEQSENTR
jgi:predicted DNA-binding protein (MmcQ/YjbR family)